MSYPLCLHRLLLTLLLMAPWTLSAFAQPRSDDSAAATFRVRAASDAITVDAVLDEATWGQATPIPLDYEWFPGDGTTPPVETACLVTFDSNHLYVAFRAQDPNPDAIRAHLMDRDDIFPFVENDHVTFMIDPFNDERRGFQFRINPLGVQADAIFSELDGVEDFSWDAIWASAGQITPTGYVVEIAIPFHQLRFPNTKTVQTWGFSASRSYPRSVRRRITSHYRDRDRSCLMCQFNKLTGFRGLSAGANLELAPTFTASRTDRRTTLPDGDFDTGSIDLQPGLTVRWGPSPNVILNGTMNPDFSQVEADVAQLEVNNRFALFFPERRPFFLEGLDFFQTPIQAVFTRTVTDPIAGLKATSKAGRNAIGVFAARDRVNNLILPSNQQSRVASLDANVSSAVLRYRRDVGDGSALGVLYTGRESENYRNHVGGVDGFLRLSGSNTLTFQYLRAHTRYPESVAAEYDTRSDAFGGNAFTLAFSHQSRRWIANAEYEDFSPTFRDDSGFIPRVDTRTGTLGLTHRIWGDTRDWFTQVNVGLDASRTVDYDGNLTDQLITASVDYSGPLQSFVLLRADVERQRFGLTVFDLRRAGTFIELKPTGALSGSIAARYGHEIDVANVRRATSFRLEPGVTWRIGRHINVGLDYSVQRLRAADARLFTEQLVQSRLLYHFNTRLFVRSIGQYRTVDRNVANYTVSIDDRSDQLFLQLLLSYTINPQSVLFVGYSGNAVGSETYALTPTNRSFFLKLGYARVL